MKLKKFKYYFVICLKLINLFKCLYAEDDLNQEIDHVKDLYMADADNTRLLDGML